MNCSRSYSKISSETVFYQYTFNFILLSVFLFSAIKTNAGTNLLSKSKPARVLQSVIMREATWALMQQPITVTAETSGRSAGGKHDFFSEGDYWWSDPKNPSGPYIQKDGMTNPDNFVAHRQAMIRFSRIVGALASAYKLTGDKKYADHALVHLKAWFVDPETLMNPNLLYAQAIQGRFTGRGIGIIDTIHLMEVAQGVLVMKAAFNETDVNAIKNWFSRYLDWLTSHQYGKDEMNAKNNHGTCWVMQVASFAKLTGNQELLDFCVERYKRVLLPDQMAADGSFPLELARTKPYGYSIFNLDAMTIICQILSNKKENLWNYKTSEGKWMHKGIEFLYPYVAEKDKWPFKKDVMYWENWPVAQPFLVMGAAAYGNKKWFHTWKKLDHSPEVEEVLRNLPIRNPLIWLD
ncbi:alginate lyase family protein [Desertivirga xinjiangensis]|uniref:alginate lyase family protein n=1 Tax=Desertivirga xinjiangensis TaxID=539206 RepID=UPI00210AE95B|nr:alginate lyase family protein [Pedobacter xinjiangensis]